ncbi:MAG: hypothetical protein ACXVXF_07060, partial [Mycobacteriaceae bacterium]
MGSHARKERSQAGILREGRAYHRGGSPTSCPTSASPTDHRMDHGMSDYGISITLDTGFAETV